MVSGLFQLGVAFQGAPIVGLSIFLGLIPRPPVYDGKNLYQIMLSLIS